MNNFYSNGKLLLTAEYLVLDGAEALAVPTKFGQQMQVDNAEKGSVFWKSFDEKKNVWFEVVFSFIGKLEIKETTNKETAETLLNIFNEVQKSNSSFLKDTLGFRIETHIDFPKDWGLGTSSTLINNIAQWAKVDAFALQQKIFGGSGYDIACAQNNNIITFSNKENTVKEVNLNWNFKDEIFFVYLNKKQNSREAITHYKNLKGKTLFIKEINQLTQQFVKCTTLTEFESLITAHENLLSSILKIPTVKNRLFFDYKGSIKSLGAWGGDFVMATRKEALDYFYKKGFRHILSFDEMVLPS